MKLNDTTTLLKQTYSEWSGDKGPRLGAALAYYAIFSIPPLMIIALAAIGFIYSGDIAGRVQAQLGTLIGDQASKTLMTGVQLKGQKGGLIAGLVGIGILIFGASGVFAELQDALNTIWKVKPKEEGIKSVVKGRFTGGAAMAHFLELGTSFVIIALLFAMIFKILPDIKIAWRQVWVGAVVTALLFTIGKFAIGMYIGKMSIGSGYGAAGSIVILITWVYYSAQILYFGAEFTHVWAKRHGAQVIPAENATSTESGEAPPSAA